MLTPPRLLSIQSHVAFGHVGHAAATFALRRLSVDVHPVHTVVFSSHPGYDGWRGEMLAPDLVAGVLGGLFDSGVLEGCRAILTGYLGHPDNANAVLKTVHKLRQRDPGSTFVCDPVLGDAGQTYVHPDLVVYFTEVLAPIADVLTPNLHELGWLAGHEIRSMDDARAAAAALRARGTKAVVATGLRFGDDPEQHVLVDADWGTHLVSTPHIPRAFTGTGDLFTALLTARLLHGYELARAAQLAASALVSVLELTHASGSRELMLIPAQDALLEPTRPDVTCAPR
jgi:pyridoxine kinase